MTKSPHPTLDSDDTDDEAYVLDHEPEDDYSCPFGNQDCEDEDRCLDCQRDADEADYFDRAGDR